MLNGQFFFLKKLFYFYEKKDYINLKKFQELLSSNSIPKQESSQKWKMMSQKFLKGTKSLTELLKFKP